MKLDLILENVKNKYTMKLLEESNLPDVSVLKSKILINESIMDIRGMLIDNSLIENTRLYVNQLFQEALVQETGVGIGGVSSAGIMAGGSTPIATYSNTNEQILNKKLNKKLKDKK